MRDYNPNSKSVLPAVRGYLKLLVATVAILSISLIGYLYWLNNQHHKLETVANYYHLETILYCTQIKEEMTQIPPADSHSQLYTKPSSGREPPQTVHNNTLYLTGKHLQTISEIHQTHAALSDRTASIEPVIRKARRQLAKIKTALQEPRGASEIPDLESVPILLNSFAVSI